MSSCLGRSLEFVVIEDAFVVVVVVVANKNDRRRRVLKDKQRTELPIVPYLFFLRSVFLAFGSFLLPFLSLYRLSRSLFFCFLLLLLPLKTFLGRKKKRLFLAACCLLFVSLRGFIKTACPVSCLVESVNPKVFKISWGAR